MQCQRRCPRFDFSANPVNHSGTPHHVHHAWCDSCHKRIVGSRYKCELCDDYDLCEGCFNTNQVSHNIHSQAHTFYKLTGPMTPALDQHFANKPRVAIPLVRLNEPVPQQQQVPVAAAAQVEVPLVPELVPSVAVPAAAAPLRSSNINESENGERLFEKNLQQLAEMGFTDRARNIEALVKSKNDLVRAIRELCA